MYGTAPPHSSDLSWTGTRPQNRLDYASCCIENPA